jgi:hypothetical protein
MVLATTKERVKALAGGFTDATYDALIDQLIPVVSQEIEMYLGYPLARVQYTEVYDVNNRDEFVFLRVLPVVTVDSVKHSTEYDFTGVTALTANDDYRATVGMTGELSLLSDLAGGLQVVYTAGMGVATANIIADFPNVAHAAEMQVIEELRRRNLASQSSAPGAGGQSHGYFREHGLLERSAELLSAYRRLVLRAPVQVA